MLYFVTGFCKSKYGLLTLIPLFVIIDITAFSRGVCPRIPGNSEYVHIVRAKMLSPTEKGCVAWNAEGGVPYNFIFNINNE